MALEYTEEQRKHTHYGAFTCNSSCEKKLEKTGKQNGKCAIIMSDYLPNGEVRIFM